MKNLFIDSNIWLSLYHYSNNDLNEFAKIKDMIGTEVNLLVTEQIKDEVARNREAKIDDSLSRFTFSKMSIPSFCKNYPQYDEFRKKQDEINTIFNDWHSSIQRDVNNNSAPSDILIREIFENSRVHKVEREIYDKALRRYNVGNPPGKNNSYGDAINWEILLDVVPEGEDLYFISDDKDYKSLIDKNSMNPFLLEEWKKKKKSNIYFYSSLAGFVKEHIDKIILKNEKDRKDLIDALCDSGSFAMTHAIIAQLDDYVDWSRDEIEEMCTAANNNNQIAWVLMDEDVNAFYKKLLHGIFVGDMTNNMLEVYDVIDGFSGD